jgi:hypothetical protein
MTVLTRTGCLVSEGPLQEIKKELTVRAQVNGDYGFPPPPFKVFRPTKNGVCVPRFYGSAKLGEPKERQDDPNLHVSKPNLLDSSETPPTKMKHSQQPLKQVMASCLYHVAMGRRRYPWL